MAIGLLTDSEYLGVFVTVYLYSMCLISMFILYVCVSVIVYTVYSHTVCIVRVA